MGKRRNGIGLFLEHIKHAVKLKRKSDSVRMMSVISAYVSQVSCELEEIEGFVCKLTKMVEQLSKEGTPLTQVT